MDNKEKWNSFLKSRMRKLRANKIDNWLYFVITNPDLYLKNLLKRSLVTGLVALVIVYIVDRSGYHSQVIPNSIK